jgi:hypothetical protein
VRSLRLGLSSRALPMPGVGDLRLLASLFQGPVLRMHCSHARSSALEDSEWQKFTHSVCHCLVCAMDHHNLPLVTQGIKVEGVRQCLTATQH